MAKQRVIVGMSGGVDSSVAAYLLKEQGYEVIGVTMQIWQQEQAAKDGGCGQIAAGNEYGGPQASENSGCCGLEAVEDARRVAETLQIPYYVMNFRREFKENVIDYFTAEYMRGRTPNPCIACNRYIKWQALLQKSLALGADYIATGHYARIVQLANGRYTLKTAVSSAKDQTYALYNLTQHQLAHTLMPVGAYSKEEVRAMAEQIGLRTANKPDSQEICFVPDGDYASFIAREMGGVGLPEGNFVTEDGTVLGQHKGITHYTIGQRKGLGLALGHPVFVTEIRPQTNEVVIGSKEAVFGQTLTAADLNFMAVEDLTGEISVTAKIRYNHQGSPCVIKKTGDDRVECYFPQPVRAITPGQAVVFYQQGVVLGGGTIC